MPAGVMYPEETVGFIAKGCMSSGIAKRGHWTSLQSAAWRSFLLDPFSPPFSSTAWRSFSYLPTGALGCLCLPCPQLPPVTPPCLPNPCSLLPGAVKSFPLTPFLPYMRVSHQPSKELVTPAPLMLEKTSLEYEAEDNGKKERFISLVMIGS